MAFVQSRYFRMHYRHYTEWYISHRAFAISERAETTQVQRLTAMGRQPIAGMGQQSGAAMWRVMEDYLWWIDCSGRDAAIEEVGDSADALRS